MKKYILIFILLFFLLQILIFSNDVIKAVRFAFDIWKNNVFPSLFPFFVLSEILIKLGFVEMVGTIFKPIMKLLFNTKGESAFIFIMSIISGNPGNAKYTRELYDKNIIDKNEASKLLMFTHFCNPLFILGTIGTTFFGSYRMGLILLISHYLGNIFIGICVRNKFMPLKNNENQEKRTSNHDNIGVIITNSLFNSINTLILILGVISMCLVLTTIISNNLPLNEINTNIVSGIIEVTQGVKYLSISSLPIKLKGLLTVIFLSFGGLSIHMQVISMISGTKIKYLPFFFARIAHAIISGIIYLIIYNF
jgi:sporulation integral membrane protein YlbJ